MTRLAVVFPLLCWGCAGIKMSVSNHPRCVIESFWSVELVKGTFSWTNPHDAALSFEIRDHTTGNLMHESSSLKGDFEVFGKQVRFCFVQTPKPPCVGQGWKQTGGCNPHGPREPHHDRGCDATVENGMSGYCDCTRRVNIEGQMTDITDKKYFSCDHEPFTCNDVCADDERRAAVTFDFVAGKVANSIEDLGTLEHLETADKLFQVIVQETSQLLDDTVGARDDEAQHRDMSENQNALVVWLRLSSIGFFIFSSVMQILAVRSEFRRRKVI